MFASRQARMLAVPSVEARIPRRSAPALPRQAAGPAWDLGRIAILPPKLTIGAVNDPLELEADRAADRVMRRQRVELSKTGEQIQRRCADCEEDEAKKAHAKGDKDDELLSEAANPKPKALAKSSDGIVRRRGSPGAGPASAPPIVDRVLQRGGQPLEKGARSMMERHFSHDFSRVRIHHDSEASASAEAIRAEAYTVGPDIVFRAGRYDPASAAGQHLLAHELAHVVQQGQAGRVARRVQRKITTSIADDGKTSGPLDGCNWGLTIPRSVDETCVAVKSGGTWKADPTALVGHYSQQVRLLKDVQEVTGPTGNSKSDNYCDQVAELSLLGLCPGHWYMLAAVKAHEDVHATRFLPGLNDVAGDIQKEFNGVTVPDAKDKTAEKALAELQALPAYATAKGKMFPAWIHRTGELIKNDHDPDGPCDKAEHKVVDPMVKSLCNQAKKAKWPACTSCP